MGDHLAAGRLGARTTRWSPASAVAGCCAAITLTAPVAAAVADAALDAGFIINAPRPDVLRLAPPLIITAAQLDTFVAALPELLDRAGRRSRHDPAALPGRRRPEPGRADRGPRPRRRAQGRPVHGHAVRRPAHGRGALRQADAAHPDLVRGRHRRARRLPDDRRRRGWPASAAASRWPTPPGSSAGRRRRSSGGPSPRPICEEMADLRRRAGGQRADRRLPPLPDPGRPADHPGAQAAGWPG